MGQYDQEEQDAGFATPWKNLSQKPWEIKEDPEGNPAFKKPQIRQEKRVSGIGIEDAAPDIEKNNQIMASLNQLNAGNLEEEEEKIRLARQKEEEEAGVYRMEQRKSIYQERYEQEQKEKAEREAREEEERQREEAEEQEKRQNSLLYKMGNKIGNVIPKQKKDAEKEPLAEEQTPHQDENKKEKPVKEKKEKTVKEPAAKEKPAKKKGKEPTKDYKYLATHDSVTGLQNKVALEEVTNAPYKQTAVIYILTADMENLRRIGEETENAVLRSVGERITDAFGEKSYYLGHGAFLVILPQEESGNALLSISRFHGSVSGTHYSVFAGKAVWETSFSDAIEEARQEALSKQNERLVTEGKRPAKTVPYNSLLTKDQQELKAIVEENHEMVSRDRTRNFISEIKARAPEILAILITDSKFDTLFIIRDVTIFIKLTSDMDYQMDYSYLYVLYQGGPKYFGSDEYYSKITHLFEDISQGLLDGTLRNTKDLMKIKGINIFQHIYFN